MRVLHLTLSAAQGGRRDAILTLIDHLRPLGTECGLVALRDSNSDVSEVVQRVDYYGGLDFAGRPTVHELRQVARTCRDRQVDVLHAHDAGSQFVASVLRLSSPRLRAVMTFHRTIGVESEGFRNVVRNGVSLPFVQRVITASEDRRRYFLSRTLMSPEKVEVIPFGVDLNRFRPNPPVRGEVRAALGIEPDAVLALAIGHFGREKGIDQVLESMARAAAHTTVPWHLAVLGSGNADDVVRMHELGARLLGGRVTFLGFRADVEHWLQGADLLIHAPRAEAYGLALVQAMASGLPIVATAVGGVPEAVLDSRTGHLAQAGDVDAIGRAAAQLIGNAGTRRRMGAAALARANMYYDARVTAARHLAMYDAVVRDRTGRRRSA